uniref:Uncharacterized protein n=1 Tax=Vitis vinifera TaxID=29760 RepID=F6I1I3_VITVI
MAREMRPRLLSKMLALGPDKTFGQESGAHSEAMRAFISYHPGRH